MNEQQHLVKQSMTHPMAIAPCCVACWSFRQLPPPIIWQSDSCTFLQSTE